METILFQMEGHTHPINPISMLIPNIILRSFKTFRSGRNFNDNTEKGPAHYYSKNCGRLKVFGFDSAAFFDSG
jgi:hypothetical protein